MSLDAVNERRGAGFWLHAGLALIGSLVVVFLGGLLAWQGFELVRLGGSYYYLLAGIGLVASGALLALRRPLGGLIFGLTLLVTVAWALWESGLTFWPLLPRVLGPAVIGVVVVLVLFSLRRTAVRRAALAASAIGVVGAFAVLAIGLVQVFSAGQAKASAEPARAAAPPAGPAAEWRFYGRDPGGSRHAPLQQINTSNVGQLQEAWRIRTGDLADRGSEDQDTPSQIGDTVYICTPRNIVIAVDADTGKEKWRHDPKIKGGGWNRCRGVGYHETAANPGAAPAIQPASASALRPSAAPTDLCRRRIISTTIDARIFALDAATGQRCPGFGVNGEVDLRPGMGEVKAGFYFPTSAPTIARDLIIIGGWVQDNRELGEPSGVVRAFSVLTGELVWAWDLGNPAITKLPPEGQTYTRGTPNVWSTPSFDDALGLVYLPTGNATPDYWGSHRTDLADEYNSSVVALDIATGRERWHFRTVNHDVWDWDVPAQPMLIDFPNGQGGTTPAVLQLTKRGETFVLDRRTGAPLTPVEQKPTPQKGSAPGEWVAPTQPYSTGMPALQAEKLTESMMWGVTPLDQLACRIAFKKLRYDGDFTPQGVTPILQYPGNAGGQNWNSGAYDPERGYLLTPGLRNPITVVLRPSNRPEHQLTLAPNRSAKSANARPYRSANQQFMSPFKLPWLEGDKGEIKIPCLQPPHGQLTAIDLKTRKIAWQVPLGTAERSGPFGWYSGLKIPVGTFGLGGVITTGGGLAFHGATQDPYLRAYDTATGKVLWKARLPVGAGGTPMTYVSPATGRQYVVVTVGGARRMPERGDYVIAYALPK